jgi:hypothetical protein
MRLFEFEFNHDMQAGAHEPVDSNKLLEAIEFVKSNCGQFLKEVSASNQFLYRGIDRKFTSSDIFTGKPQDFRNPVETNSESTERRIADVCNALLKEAGFTALRNNSLFCTSSLRDAKPWGAPCIMFFLDGYSFGYSKKVTGSPAVSYKYPSDSINNGFSRSRNITTMAIDKDNAEQFVIDNGFTNSDLRWAMENEHDVWVRGNFIAFDYKYEKALRRTFL